MASSKTAIEIISQPLNLPCGLTLPNRLVKCPMQETCAEPPTFDPPLDKWRNIYKTWAHAQYGMLLTGQVQIDIRFLSIAGDVVIHENSMHEPVFSKWKEWAQIAQEGGTPCVVQLAHPGRMSPAGAGIRPGDMQALCPSSVPVKLGDSWLDKMALDKLLGTPKEMTTDEIDEAIDNFKTAALVCKDAGFAGVQLHGAHGFLISQFLSPYTNRRTDEYGGTPEKRLKFLKRLVTEVREICPTPFCLGVKLNSGDYMGEAGLSQDEALEQVRWLVTCGLVDFVEISGGNAEQTSSKLHASIYQKTLPAAPKTRASTRIREAFFTEFAERVHALGSSVPIQLSGGFRSRIGMADAIDSRACDLIGIGRPAVLQPSLPTDVLLNPDVPDDQGVAKPHVLRGQWLSNMFPVKVVGSSFNIEFFYWNMRRLGRGLRSDPNASIPWVVFSNILGGILSMLSSITSRAPQSKEAFRATRHAGTDGHQLVYLRSSNPSNSPLHKGVSPS